jgi:hypothetical protein
MEPSIKPACRLVIYVDGTQASQGKTIGDLKVVGIGAAGSVTLEALTGNPKGSVSFEIQCETCGPTTKTYPVGAPTVYSPPPANGIPECGEDCFVIDYQFGDPVADAWIFGDRTWPMPADDSGLYNIPDTSFAAMRTAVQEEAAKLAQKFKSYSKGCSDDCTCQKNSGATPIKSTPWNVEVKAPFVYPDGKATTVLGHFSVVQLKTPGTCRPNVP